ncbi:penicillin binding protein PBP4B [Bowmanella sp. JS7-9]|uniref:Penicillin binding protein PBP4B n=1 Tax=Pseudobowmanella zhangzhouensis TaxID=1537679 RepID=A0ABW1XLZ8_9ALTE
MRQLVINHSGFWRLISSVVGGAGLILAGCTSLPMESMPSANFSERVKFLVLHYTAIDYADSRRALVDAGGLSAHYLVPESGDSSYAEQELKIYKLVDETQRAWHAGNSFWQGREDINDQSIGIEIVNVPTCVSDARPQPEIESSHTTALVETPDSPLPTEDPYLPDVAEPAKFVEVSPIPAPERKLCVYPDYDRKQIALLIDLIQGILARNPDIGPTQVIGHADIAPGRKQDPGPRFPWFELYKAGIGAWYEQETVQRYWQQFSSAPPSVGLIQSALRAYGYEIAETGIYDKQTTDVIDAFQMHFLPWQVSGRADAQTASILFALLERYFPSKAEKLFARYRPQDSAPAQLSLRFGQIDEVFPEPEDQRSERQLVNDKRPFFAYAGRGELIIDNRDATSAEILINDQLINISTPLSPHQHYRYDLGRRTRDGVNTLEVRNVQPEGASLTIRVPYPTLAAKTSNDKRFAKVDALIKQEVADGFPGAVLMVMQHGQIIKHSAYGYQRKYADGGSLLPQPVPMTEDTLFDLASNTKMFATNLALMKLVSDGRLDVSLPISHYLPEYRDNGRDIRLVRDLLTHSAGYAPQVGFHTPDNPLGKRFFSHDGDKTRRLLTQHVPFTSGRGQGHVYSDTDYMLLGVLIERIAGVPLDVYVESQIYHPLHLHHTMFNPVSKGIMPSQVAATEIHGTTRAGRVEHPGIRHYVLQGEVHDEKAWYAMQGVAGHAGLFSNGEDMAVLCQLLLNRGGYGQQHIFDPGVLDMFLSPEVDNATYGLGWRRAGNGQQRWHFGAYASPQAYGHTGWTGTVTVIDPAYDLAIVLLSNLRHSDIVEDEEGNAEFVGKQFETGKYGSIVTLIYEALLNGK